MRVIGTAGHVDHGKSTLVKALTGINPDRLKEEQVREVTIELGFAWMTLPDGEEAGIVDVPGHRDFIENMLSGVGGIDAVVFVVAADEGVMPQTREHLAIVDLLQISGGVVALTKVDLVDDPAWLDLVEDDLRRLLGGTVLENAPIVRVSAVRGDGMTELVTEIENCLKDTPKRSDTGKPRLAVDRVFTIAGFGTVVTGTLIDGVLKIGDEVEILPSGLRGRVRGLQTHKKKEQSAQPGARTAVNVSGVEVEQIKRGDVVCKTGQYKPVSRMDVHFRLLPDASAGLRHNDEVKIFHGASESTARVRLLGAEELKPGGEGWLQLELSHALVAVRGDRYILRRPSPGETLGGGVVVDASPRRRHKRFDEQVLARLAQLLKGAPDDLLNQALLQSGPQSEKDLRAKVTLSVEDFTAGLVQLRDRGQVLSLPAGTGGQAGLLAAAPWLEAESRRLLNILDEYHQRNPLRAGIPREELKSRLKYPAGIFAALLTRLAVDKQIQDEKGLLRRAGFAIRFSAEQKKQITVLLGAFVQTPNSPPTVKECEQAVGADVYDALLATGQLVQLTPEVVYRTEDYERLVSELKAWLTQKGSISVAEFRDHYQTSRRYALAFLEHMDQTGVTVREGDIRRLGYEK